MPSYEVSDETVARYRRNYGLDASVGRSEVEQHLTLERTLTDRLMASRPDERWAVFEEAYTTLYASLPWLNTAPPAARDYRAWDTLLPQPSDVFEIGSGRAELLRYLAGRGHRCVATEITRERGAKHAEGVGGIEWHITDGVHLDRFEQPQSYDAVISSQVIEHIHPDDLNTHFSTVRTLLRPGGRYIFDTPHRGTGPHDLSVVLNKTDAEFMHLREYDYSELRRAAKAAGFARVEAVVVKKGRTFQSALLAGFYDLADRAIGSVGLKRRTEIKLRRGRLFEIFGPFSNIWLSATA